MTVCTFYEQLGKFLGNRKNNEFPGKLMEITGRESKKLPALENHFHPETIGFQYVYFLLQLQLNLQNERYRSLLKTAAQAGCHEMA